MTSVPSTRAARMMSAAAGLLMTASLGFAGPGIRVVSWNITNYAGGRTADLQGTFYGVVPTGLALAGQSMDPDIVIAQEIVNEPAAIALLNALNTAPGSPGDWDMEIFTLSPDTSTAFYFRTSKVENLGSQIAVFGGNPSGAPRHVIRYDWRPVGYSTNASRVASFGVHMKAGNTATDISRRAAEATAIKNYITTMVGQPANAGINFMVLGDFNIPAVNETAYQTLTNTAAGVARLFDPINSPGSWADVSVFRFIHTQDPATSAGMDDRYDQILCSASLLNGQGMDYIGNPSVAYSTTTWNDPNHSYRAWGNDGTSFNTFLRVTGNTMVGAAIAQDIIDACTTAGGHIPVFLDMKVPARGAVSTTTLDFGTVFQGSTAELPLTVSNAGNAALFTAAGVDALDYTLAATSGFSVPTGPFSASAGTPGGTHQVAMSTSMLGPKSGTLTVTSDDPETPTLIVNLTGNVVVPPACPGDFNGDLSVNINDLTIFLGNFGNTVAPGTNGDMDGNGVVNISDLTLFLAAFGTSC